MRGCTNKLSVMEGISPVCRWKLIITDLLGSHDAVLRTVGCGAGERHRVLDRPKVLSSTAQPCRAGGAGRCAGTAWHRVSVRGDVGMVRMGVRCL